MNRTLPLVAALIVALGAGAWVLSRSGGNEAMSSSGIVTAALADTASTTANDQQPMAPDYSIGNPDAPVHVIEYASFTCPHCRDFHDEVYKKLKTNYIDTGKVYFTLREVYFDQFGLMAGQIARCGGEMRYYGIVDMIYNTQKDWIGSGNGTEIAANLKKLGKVAGLTEDQINTCLNDKENAKAMINAFQTHFTEDGIDGTPTFMINGKKYTNPVTYDKTKSIIDEALAAAAAK
jgi:protein-disulfide isomerase